VSGVSVGTNDLAQLMLGVDRDNSEVGYLYDDGHPAVVKATCSMIQAARAEGLQTSVCGDRPSRDEAFVSALLAANVDTISVPHYAVAEMRESMSAALSLQGGKDGI
jgi:pyruvate, water dikinase